MIPRSRRRSEAQVRSPACLDIYKNKTTDAAVHRPAGTAAAGAGRPEETQERPDGQRLRHPQSAVAPGVVRARRPRPAGGKHESRRGIQPAEEQKQYTVRVATFRGASTMKLPEIKRNGAGLPSKLEEAAIKAHELTLALRKQGVEAYEFHDRYESIVTIGSFNRSGAAAGREDGNQSPGPPDHGDVRPQPPTVAGTSPGRQSSKALNGISFDVQPVPVEVPRRSWPPPTRPAASCISKRPFTNPAIARRGREPRTSGFRGLTRPLCQAGKPDVLSCQGFRARAVFDPATPR